jgi:hypothetical protein
MKRLLVIALAGLSGCVDMPPPAPSPAVQQMMASCDAGNLQACESVAQLEAQERARRSAIPPPTLNMPPMDASPYMNNTQMTYQPTQMCSWVGQYWMCN